MARHVQRQRAPVHEAQMAKMHHVCRKLRLNADESVVAAGSDDTASVIPAGSLRATPSTMVS